MYDVTSPTYGAAGDGVNDDRAAIQAAIDAASLAGGGTVYLPNGTYRVTRQSVPNEGCLYLYSNVELRGESRNAVIKMADNQSAFTRVIRVQGQDDVRICNLTIDGNKSGQAVPEEHMAGIFHGACKRFTVESCELRNCCGDGAQIYSSNEDTVYRDCYVHDNDRGGITITGTGSTRISILYSQCVNNADQQIDSELAGAGTLSDVLIHGCYLSPRSTAAVLTCSGYNKTNQATGFVVSDCTIEGPVYVVWAKNVRIVNNRVSLASGMAAGPITVDRKSEHVIIAHNQIYAGSVESSSNAAVYVQGTSTDDKPEDVLVDGNYIETPLNASGVRASGARSLVAVNNRIVGNSTVAVTRAGVSVTTSDGDPSYQMHTLLVSGNWITDFGRGVIVGGLTTVDPDYAIYEMQVTNNVFQRVNHASMQAMELDYIGSAVVDRATVFGNVGINITTLFTATTGWPAVPTLIGGNRGDGGIYSGTGSPEGALAERVGAHYFRRDGGGGTTFYVKESGTGNTGWVAK